MKKNRTIRTVRVRGELLLLLFPLFLLLPHCGEKVEEKPTPRKILGSCDPYDGERKVFVLTNPPMGTPGELLLLNPEETTATTVLQGVGDVPNRMVACGEKVYIVNSIGNTVKVLSGKTNTVVGTIFLPEGSNPMDVTFAENRGFVTSLLHNALYTFSLTDGSLGVSIPVGRSPQALFSNGATIVVANTGFDFSNFTYDPGSLTIVDPRSLTRKETISLPCTNPTAMAGEGDDLYLLCTGDYSSSFGVLVHLKGTTSFSVEGTVPVGGSPGMVVLSKNRIYIGGGYLKVYNRKDLSLIQEVESLKGTSPVNGREGKNESLYLALWVEKEVVILNPDLTIKNRIPIGIHAQDILILER
jgi:hypothetical protein